MSSKPWVEALKATIREDSAGTDGTLEKILETVPSEGCERCENPTDELDLAVEDQIVEKVCGAWGDEERGLIDAGWKPKSEFGKASMSPKVAL